MEESQLRAFREAYAQVRPIHEAFAANLAELIRQICQSAAIDVDSVTHRAKTIESLDGKLRRHPEYSSLDQMTDKSGVRVVTRFRKDVEKVVRLLQDEFAVTEVEHHGGAAPEMFGYLSSHVLLGIGDSRSTLREWQSYSGLVAEVQVRSILQHAWASISHGMDYKSDQDIPRQVRRRLFRVAALLETGDEIFDTYRDEIESIRSQYRDQVATNEYDDLPLNLDAVVASWERLPVSHVREIAMRANFSEAPAPSPRPAPWEMRAISGLVSIASAAGLRTVGQVATIMEHIDDYEEMLRAIATNADRRGRAPYAVAADIVSVILIALNADNEAVYEQATGGLVSELIDAAREVGRQRTVTGC